MTFLLNGNSNSDNFGHLLLDDLIPSLTALAIFDLPLDSGLLLSQHGCRLKMMHYDPEAETPYAHRLRRDVCLENFAVYTPLVLGRHMIDLEREWQGKSVCMKRLIAGQSSVFSLRSLDVERSRSLRDARDFIVQRLELGEVPPPTVQNVMVLLKQDSFTSPHWETICDDTKVIVHSIDPSIPVRCFNPVSQTILDQVRESRLSSVIVAEHGTTSYGALYGHDGVALLSIANRKRAKETQIHLYATHYDTYYMALEDKEAHFAGALRFVLAKASANFGFRANCSGLCSA